MKVLVIGGGAREHVLCEAVMKSDDELYAVMKNINPGIKRLAKNFLSSDERDVEKVTTYAKEKEIELAIIGPEAPEEAGLTNALEKEHIAVASPMQEAAEIETNKEFMRKIMEKYKIKGSVKCKAFSNAQMAEEFIEMLGGEVAIKPLGLTGGKGVKIAGDHFTHVEEAFAYAKEVINKEIGGEARVLIEEKMVGEEFTLQAFCDGKTIIPTPAVQDHKRLLEGDEGPNTGGMGSYSHASGILPFMERNDYEHATAILQRVVDALSRERRKYKGAIYGQFMLTNGGPKVVEINARWGDPEATNILPLLKTNFVEICFSMVDGTMSKKKVDFERKSTVCKYVVPEGYGTKPLPDKNIFVDEGGIKQSRGKLFYASVNEKNGNIYTTTSRSLAVLGIADEIDEAERMCEKSLTHIKGDHLYSRHDIGTQKLIQRRIAHMEMIRG